MDLKGLWTSISEGADWFYVTRMILVVCNLFVFVWIMMGVFERPNLHERYNLAQSDDLVRMHTQLSQQEQEDLEVPEPEPAGPVPERYVNLQRDRELIYLPLAMRVGDEILPGDGPSGDPDAPQEAPSITGYEVSGRLFGAEDVRQALVREESSGETYRVGVGEFVGESDIRAETISDTGVWLSHPDYKTTLFQFQTDRVRQRIEEGIRLQ